MKLFCLPSFSVLFNSCPLALNKVALFTEFLQLARLRRSYEKLQKKQLRDAREEANKRQGDDQFEMSRLSRKLEVGDGEAAANWFICMS